MDDAQILRLMRKDPNAAMRQLIDQYAGLVCAVVRGKLRGAFCLSSDIEECVADVFSEFYLGRAAYDPQKASIKAYLCVIARHNAADLLRKRQRQRGDLSADADGTAELADDLVLESTLAEKQMRRTVFDAIGAMGEPDRSILLQKFYYGRTSREIADALGLSVSNVDTRASRALQKLRDLFGGTSK